MHDIFCSIYLGLSIVQFVFSPQFCNQKVCYAKCKFSSFIFSYFSTFFIRYGC